MNLNLPLLPIGEVGLCVVPAELEALPDFIGLGVRVDSRVMSRVLFIFAAISPSA
jgi:hypothetical protein